MWTEEHFNFNKNLGHFIVFVIFIFISLFVYIYFTTQS